MPANHEVQSVSKIAEVPAVRAALFAATAAMAIALSMRPTPANATESLDAASFTIMSADGGQVLGHGEYHLENSGPQPVLIGNDRYFDGEYDIERDVISSAANTGVPALVSFEHSFFNADGSRKFFARADLPSGEAECSSYEAGRQHSALQHVDFPADTYAGATAVVALEAALRTGGGQAAFHVFDCGPAPSVVAVAAQADQELRGWSLYPGRLTQVDVTADLGWLGSLVDGLLPHRRAWFDPTAGWRFVGGKIQRYFASGPQVMLVRESTALAQHASN
jgi:hypothetical protein